MTWKEIFRWKRDIIENHYVLRITHYVSRITPGIKLARLCRRKIFARDAKAIFYLTEKSYG